tara:strand:+ start:595 stop:798 length:204 start_codon:yes stop_codon:yes gene_type:complete
MSQQSEILNYLKRGKSITPKQALSMFGCLSLAQRIADLKHKDNMPITKTMIKVSKNTHVARYSLGNK